MLTLRNKRQQNSLISISRIYRITKNNNWKSIYSLHENITTEIIVVHVFKPLFRYLSFNETVICFRLKYRNHRSNRQIIETIPADQKTSLNYLFFNQWYLVLNIYSIFHLKFGNCTPVDIYLFWSTYFGYWLKWIKCIIFLIIVSLYISR